MAHPRLPPDFALERFFAKYEFNSPFLLCCSDAESMSVSELISMADSESLSLWTNLSLGYTESTGHPLLKQEVAQLHHVTPDQVLILAPQEGIYIAMKCLITLLIKKFNLDKLHVISTFPSYQSLYENANTSGCEVDYWKPVFSQGDWMFDVEHLKSLLKPHTRLIVVNFPHNPTGFIPDNQQWMQLIELCQERDIFLFSDEMYRFTNNDGSAALESACSLYANAVSLFGMSKTYGLPGLRIGWLCTQHKELMPMMKSYKDYTTICCSAPSEILSIIALRNEERIRQQVMKIVRDNLVLLDQFFNDFDDIFTWKRPSAGTTSFVQIKGWLSDLCGHKASRLAEVLAKERGVLVLPGEMFEYDDQFIRIGFGRKNLPEVLHELRGFLEMNKPSTQ